MMRNVSVVKSKKEKDLDMVSNRTFAFNIDADMDFKALASLERARR